MLLTLGTHTYEGYGICFVCVRVHMPTYIFLVELAVLINAPTDSTLYCTDFSTH